MSDKKKLSRDIKILIKAILVENNWESRSNSHKILLKFFKKQLEIYNIDDLRSINIDSDIEALLKQSEFNTNEIKNIIKLIENAKFDENINEFIEIFIKTRKWKPTSNKITLLKNILISLNIFNIQDIRDMIKDDSNLNILRKTRLSNNHVDDIIKILNIKETKNFGFESTDYDLIKNKINNKELKSEDYNYLFQEYKLEPYDNYLKKLLLTYLQKQIK